jgi:TRAP-type uncharacterized transport system substrate-binding protein
MDPTKFPTWLRVTLVAGIVILVAGASLFAWRWYSRPTTLTIAVGSFDGEASRVVAALAGKLAQQKAPVRLNVVETDSAVDAAEAFSSGKVDLAVVRGDVGDLSQAQAVAIVAHAVVLLVVPPGSTISDMAGLKRLTVGVIGGDINKRLIKVLTDEYDLARAGVTFKNLAPADVRRALETKDVRAILIVMPLAEKYLALLRGLFQHGAKTGPVLIPIESAGAIAERERAYESFDVPKGTLRGSPPNPADDVTTLRTAFGQISTPDTDASAYIPLHPGAAAFYNGTQESFLDEWGNIIFLAPMIAGALISVLAAAWKFLRAGEPLSREEALDALYALGQRIRISSSVAELDEIEREIDRLLLAQRKKEAVGDEGVRDVVAVNVAAHRLENLIHDRRLALAPQGSKTGEPVQG